MSERVVTWSYGGGVQSIALAVAVRRGLLPRPKYIIMADTGRESSATWQYLDNYVQPLLAEVGLSVEIAPHTLARVDLYSAKGKLLIPAWTANGGKLPAYCSVEWKRRVVRRYLRALGVRQCRTWIGFSTDEIERIKPSDEKWQEYWWPLAMDLGWNRATCHGMIADAGLPPAPKSACYDCANRNNAEWRAIRAIPGEWQAAIEQDRAVRARDKQGGVYLHFSGKPLDEADIDNDQQLDLWSECGNACFT